MTQTETSVASVLGTNDRKRSYGTPAASIPSLKRSKVMNSGPSNVLSLSEEEEKIPVTGTNTSSSLPLSAKNEVKPTPPTVAVVRNDLSGGRGSRGHTPPIVIDEAEMERKVYLQYTRKMLTLNLSCVFPLVAER